jgi:hypothetical protein
MSYAIDIAPASLALLEELPRRSSACVFAMLEQLAELADLWEWDDPRWARFVQRDAEGLHFYVGGCCVRLELHRDTRRLVVREIGRVLVHLPPQGQALGSDFVGSYFLW